MTATQRHDRRGAAAESGSALVPVVIIVVICTVVALAGLLPAIGQRRAARALLESERAFQLAESGVDWGIAGLRASGGVLPTVAIITRGPHDGASGEFTLKYVATGRSVHADGRVDDGESPGVGARNTGFVQLVSTGSADGPHRTIRVMLRRSVMLPSIDAALRFGTTAPAVDVGAHSIVVSGFEHRLDGTEDRTRPPRAAISAPTSPSRLASALSAISAAQIVGLGGAPAVAQSGALDLGSLIDQAQRAATHDVEPGTHAARSFGSPTRASVVLAVCDGDLHLAGTTVGSGVLVVDGDLVVSGAFEWTGIVIVRGRLDVKRRATRQRVVGALLIGDGVATEATAAKNPGEGGDAARAFEVLFSGAAIALAEERLGMLAVHSWVDSARP